MRKTNRLHLLLTAAALAIGSLLAINARGAVGDIYETNMDKILRMNPIGGVTPGTFASGLASPKGLVFDGNGQLYVADASAGTIYVVHDAGRSGQPLRCKASALLWALLST